jgi:NADH:ubiquinone oxidoreductase subunit 4 (subunit M)
VGTVIEAAYFFRVVQAAYFKGPREEPGVGGGRSEEAPLHALVPLVGLLGLILVVGVYPQPLLEVLESCASELLNRIDYITGVLG